MSAQAKNTKLHAFYRDLCISFVGSLRALSLYPQDHPETRKKVGGLFQRLTRYLDQRPSLTLLFVRGDVVVENTPLPDLSETLARACDAYRHGDVWSQLVATGMRQEWSWRHSAKEYVTLYQRTIELAKQVVYT